MSTTRKFVMSICGAIAGIGGMMLAIMPAAQFALLPESDTHYVAESTDQGDPWNSTGDGDPWNSPADGDPWNSPADGDPWNSTGDGDPWN
jgi:hypothetical protein